MSSLDVAVIGSGPAGSTTALLLARAGARVALFEASRFEQRRVGETLAPGVQALLARLGVWSQFIATAPLKSSGVGSRWGGATEHLTAPVFNAHGGGWHVDRLAFDHMLFDAACAAGAQGCTGRSAIVRRRSGWQIEASGAPAVGAAFIVDATGRRSSVARDQGTARQRGASMVASVAWFGAAPETAPPLCRIEALPEGWCYGAPQPEGGFVFVQFSTLEGARATGDDWFAASRCATLWRTQAEGRELLERRRCRAESSWLDRACGADWIAVGDAALALDPLAGDGVLRSIAMAGAAAGTLTARLGGDIAALDDYAQSVRRCAADHAAGEAWFYAREPRWPQQPFWAARR